MACRQGPVVLIPISTPAASVLRIPCELVLDMGFVPALQDLGSPERRALLRSFNHTVGVGWGGPGSCGLGHPHCAQLPPCTGLAPLHIGAWVPVAGGDEDQVGACLAPQREMLLAWGVRGASGCGATAGPGCGAGAGGLSRGFPTGRAAWCWSTTHCSRQSRCRCWGCSRSSMLRWALVLPGGGCQWVMPPSCTTQLWVSVGCAWGCTTARSSWLQGGLILAPALLGRG